MELTTKELGRHEVNGTNELCMRLVKSLYRLKQADRLWNKLLHETLLEIRSVQSVEDACVYYKYNEDGTIVA